MESKESYNARKDRLLDELDVNYRNDSQVELNLTVAKLGELEREKGGEETRKEIVEEIKKLEKEISDSINTIDDVTIRNMKRDILIVFKCGVISILEKK